MGLSSWMARLSDQQSLSDIAMPGSHDSATYVIGVPELAQKINVVLPGVTGLRGVAFVQTQTLTIREQLDHGVRFLDLRVNAAGEGFTMYHGPVPLGIGLSSVLDQVEAFLQANPSETVLTCFKRENNDDRDKISEKLREYLAKRGNCYFLEARVPKLKEVRGKAVVINRIFETRASGAFIDFDNNTTFEKKQKQGDGGEIAFAVQDCYDPLPIENGFFPSIWSFVTNPFKKALARKLDNIAEGYRRFKGGSHDYRLAFMSATTMPNLTPGEYATEINPKVRTLLRDNAGDTRWITIMDYVGEYGESRDEPCAAIISTNTFDLGPDSRRDTLQAGETLSPGDALISPSGAFKAVLQNDGNFVVYRLCDDHADAATMTHGTGADRATLQSDGNFVVYSGSTAKSATATTGRQGRRMVMQDDGNLVIYTGNGTPVWASQSSPFSAR
jgi:1-phosphatidylinositol phosphodiesterase